jgi:hypothetical protein
MQETIAVLASTSDGSNQLKRRAKFNNSWACDHSWKPENTLFFQNNRQ